MVARFYAHPQCSTCARARAWLEAQGLAFTEIDIRENPPSDEELGRLLVAREGRIKRLFNTSGMAYRQRGLGGKIDQMSQDQALALLASDGMLVKRPVFIANEAVVNGFSESEWRQKLGALSGRS